MKFSVLAAAAALCLSSATAFAPPRTNNAATVFSSKPSFTARYSSAQSEVERLRAAAAQAREDAKRLSQELGRPEEDEAKTVVKSTKSPEEIKESISSINFESGDPSAQISALDSLREEGAIKTYKYAVESGDLRNFDVSLSQLESRTGLTAEKLGIGAEEVSLDDFKYATLWVTGGCSVAGVAALAFLPENIGATVCYLVALIPILFLGVGSTAPAAIAGVIASLKGSEEKELKAERVCRHEAAHFLCGYLCGLPVAAYATTDENIPRVEFYNTRRNEPVTAQQQLSDEEVNTLAVVALSGAVAEAMKYGTAGGGSNADLLELEMTYRRSANFIGAAKQQDLTRWGALAAHRLLTVHQAKLDKLVEAFSAQRPISECVAILEQ